MTNIFREAKNLLDKKDAGGEISWAELELINTARIPLNLRDYPFPEDMPVRDCLETLAQIVEGVDDDHRRSYQGTS